MLMEPVPPKQPIFVTLAVAERTAGWVTCVEKVVEHPEATVKVTLYVPADRFGMVAPVPDTGPPSGFVRDHVQL